MLKLPPRLLQQHEYASHSKVGTAEAGEQQMRTVHSSRGSDMVVPDFTSFIYRSIMFDADQISVRHSCLGAFLTTYDMKFCTNFLNLVII